MRLNQKPRFIKSSPFKPCRTSLNIFNQSILFANAEDESDQERDEEKEDEYEEEKEQFWRTAEESTYQLAPPLPHILQEIIVRYVGDISLDLVCWRFFSYVSTWCTHMYRPYCYLGGDGIECTNILAHITSPYCPLKKITTLGISLDAFFISDILYYSEKKESKKNNNEDKKVEYRMRKRKEYLYPCNECYKSRFMIEKQLKQDEDKCQWITNQTEKLRLISTNILESIEKLAAVRVSLHEDDNRFIQLMERLPNLKSFHYSALDDDLEEGTLVFLSNHKGTITKVYDPCNTWNRPKEIHPKYNTMCTYRMIDGIPASLEEICLHHGEKDPNSFLDTPIMQELMIKILFRHRHTIQHLSFYTDNNFDWKSFITTIQSIDFKHKCNMVFRFNDGMIIKRRFNSDPVRKDDDSTCPEIPFKTNYDDIERRYNGERDKFSLYCLGYQRIRVEPRED